MTYDIYSDGALVNSIVASEEFAVAYCEANGYTYAGRIPEPAPESAPEPAPTADELVNILLGVTDNG